MAPSLAVLTAAALPLTCNQYFMFSNYFKTTWRNLVKKNKAYSTLNIAGTGSRDGRGPFDRRYGHTMDILRPFFT